MVLRLCGKEMNMVIAEELEDVLAAESEADQAEQSEATALSALRSEHYDKIVHTNMMVQSAEHEYECAKAEAASLKKRWEQLQHRLTQLIAEGPSRQQQLPFADEADTPDESWKDTAISEAIDATDKQLEKLADAGVRTVGQFESLRAGQIDGYPDGLRSIKGVGQKTVDKWEEEILEWLQQHTWGQPAEESADDADDSDD